MGRGAMLETGGPKPALDRPSEPKRGEGWPPAMEKKGLCWWWDRESGAVEHCRIMSSRIGFGHGSVKDLSYDTEFILVHVGKGNTVKWIKIWTWKENERESENDRDREKWE